MDAREITMETKKIIKISDKQQEQEYLRRMNFIPSAFKRYSDEEQDQVREKVAQLPSEELVVIYLSFWENLCEHEIAKEICSTVGKVINIKTTALLRLREMIESDQQNKELRIA